MVIRCGLGLSYEIGIHEVPFNIALQPIMLRVPLTVVLDALPLSRLCALDNCLTEEGAHLLDPKIKGNSKRTNETPISKLS